MVTKFYASLFISLLCVQTILPSHDIKTSMDKAKGNLSPKSSTLYYALIHHNDPEVVKNKSCDEQKQRDKFQDLTIQRECKKKNRIAKQEALRLQNRSHDEKAKDCVQGFYAARAKRLAKNDSYSYLPDLDDDEAEDAILQSMQSSWNDDFHNSGI